MIALLVLVSTSVDAADVWFRPAGQAYGAGNGTSYANAYSGIDMVPNSEFTASKILPGDTVRICGYHRGMLVVLDNNLTIDLVCSPYNDPGTINGADVDDGLGWQLNVNGEYQKTFLTAPKVIVRNGVILQPARPGSLTPGQWGCTPQWFTPVCDNSTGPWTVYVKDNPVGQMLEVGARNIGIQLGIRPEPGRGIRSITVQGGGVGKIMYQGGTNWGWGKGISTWSDGWPVNETSGGTWTIDGVIFIGQQNQGIHTYGDGTIGGAPSRLVIRNNQFYDIGGEALYLKGGRQVRSALIENNVIGSSSHVRHGWDAQPNCSAATGDGIDMGGNEADAISHAIIRGNSVTNTRGFGIGIAGTDILIEGNTIIHPGYRNDGCPNHAAIAIYPISDGTVTVRNNRMIVTHSSALFIGGLERRRAVLDMYANVFDLRTLANNVSPIAAPLDYLRSAGFGVRLYSSLFCERIGTTNSLRSLIPNNIFTTECDSLTSIVSPSNLRRVQ
jgi:hypothetical protein